MGAVDTMDSFFELLNAGEREAAVGLMAENAEMRIHAGDSAQTLTADGLAASRARPVAPALDSLESRADLFDFPEGHLVESFEHFVVLQLGRTLLPVWVMRLPEISFNPLDPAEQTCEPVFQLCS